MVVTHHNMHLCLNTTIQEFFRNISTIHLLPIHCHRFHTMLNMRRILYLNGELAAAIEPFHCVTVPLGRNGRVDQQSLEGRAHAKQILGGHHVHPRRRAGDLRNAAPAEFLIVLAQHGGAVGIGFGMIAFHADFLDDGMRKDLFVILPLLFLHLKKYYYYLEYLQKLLYSYLI